MLIFGSPSSGDMPIDNSYQLGTSPPSYSFLCSIQRISLNPTGCGMQRSQRAGNCLPLKSCLRILDRSKDMAPDIQVIDLPDGIITGTRGLRIEETASMTSSPVEAVTHLSAKAMNKKKVCFADSKGLLLTTVRVMDGPSDSPPRLDINLFKDVIQDEQAKPNHPYTYVPDFEQPASNYLDFRERLEKNKVCLENAVIKDNITIMGTIKVRNISFEKSVKVRVTFDKWKTFRDVPGAYVFPECSNPDEDRTPSSDKYDTFKFQFDLPPNLGGKAVLFCICFECNNTSYWDNNNNINYRIISLQEKETSEHEKMLQHYHSLSSDYHWTDVAFHSLADNERPYW